MGQLINHYQNPINNSLSREGQVNKWRPEDFTFEGWTFIFQLSSTPQ